MLCKDLRAAVWSPDGFRVVSCKCWSPRYTPSLPPHFTCLNFQNPGYEPSLSLIHVNTNITSSYQTHSSSDSFLKMPQNTNEGQNLSSINWQCQAGTKQRIISILRVKGIINFFCIDLLRTQAFPRASLRYRTMKPATLLLWVLHVSNG